MMHGLTNIKKGTIFRKAGKVKVSSGSGRPPLPDYQPATRWVHYTTSCNTQPSAPEDGRNHRPKDVELIGSINKPLLLQLVGCLYYLYR